MAELNSIYKELPIKIKGYTIRNLELKELEFYTAVCMSDYYNLYSDFKIYHYKKEDVMRAIKKSIDRDRNSSVRIVMSDSSDNIVSGVTLTNKYDKHGHYVEISYFTMPYKQGNGLCSSMISEVVNILKDKLNIERVIATVQDCNIASRKVLTKVGFTEVLRYKGAYTLNIRYLI